MPETLNNDDIRCGLFSDYEVRVWVNCNYVLHLIEERCESGHSETGDYDYLDQVGIFTYLTNYVMAGFWNDFNKELVRHEGFHLPKQGSWGDEEVELTKELISAVYDTWDDCIENFIENDYHEGFWEQAKKEYEKEEKRNNY